MGESLSWADAPPPLAPAPVEVTKMGAADGLQPRTPPDLNVLDLAVEGDKDLGQRFTLFVPKHLAKDERVPLLVLLHGLGETWDPTIGVYAWVERYGIGTAYARLKRPPVVRTSRTNLLTDAYLQALNTSLAQAPFRGIAIACPYTPNISKQKDPVGALDKYADWLAQVVVPRARKEAPIYQDRAHTTLDGVSLGGQLAYEVMIRRPDAFGAVGGVQSAINVVRLQTYVDKLGAAYAKHKPAQAPNASAGAAAGGTQSAYVRVVTSVQDPFREVNKALAADLGKKGIPNELVILPGLHDQVFLREIAGLDLLFWHDRRPR